MHMPDKPVLILILGVNDSGLSSFIYRLSEYRPPIGARNPNYPPRNVKVIEGHFGSLTIKLSLVINLLGFSLTNWTLMLEALHASTDEPDPIATTMQAMCGIIILIDDTDTETLVGVHTVLEHVRKYDYLPCTVIVSTNSDPDTPSASLRELLQLTDDEVILHCKSTDDDEARAALLSTRIKLPGETEVNTIT
jgi:signal recognition particle receptor subunit beta